MVSWQNTNYYKDLKNYEKSSGYTTAEMNYLNNPNGIHNPFVVGIASFAPSLFNILPQFIESKNTNNNDDKAEIAKNIKSDIDKIFEKYNKGDNASKDPIDNIDEIEGLLQTKYNETNSSIESLEEDNSNLEKSNQNINNFLVNFDSNIDQIEMNIKKYESSIKACKSAIYECNDAPMKNLEISNLKDLESKKNDLITQREKLIKQKAENEKQLEENLSQIVKNNELLNEFKSIQKDIKDLKELSKQLKKAEGKEAIESLTNNETNNIVKLLSEYNKAKQGSDLDKINKTKSELVEALKAYNGDNKTFLNLKQQFRVS